MRRGGGSALGLRKGHSINERKKKKNKREGLEKRKKTEEESLDLPFKQKNTALPRSRGKPNLNKLGAKMKTQGKKNGGKRGGGWWKEADRGDVVKK